MREVPPVRGLTTEKERQTTDAEVWIRISNHKTHVSIWCELARPQTRADASIAPADYEQTHELELEQSDATTLPTPAPSASRSASRTPGTVR